MGLQNDASKIRKEFIHRLDYPKPRIGFNKDISK
jgi:hypothetical protein